MVPLHLVFILILYVLKTPETAIISSKYQILRDVSPRLSVRYEALSDGAIRPKLRLRLIFDNYGDYS